MPTPKTNAEPTLKIVPDLPPPNGDARNSAPVDDSSPQTEVEAIPPNPFDDPAVLRRPDGAAPSTSPFDDLEALKQAWQNANDSEDEDEGAVDILTTVPIRRPGKKWFAAHPSDDYLHFGCVIEDATSGLHYYVMPAVAELMTKDEEARKVVMALCINRNNVLFFWPFSRIGTWQTSGMTAIKAARTNWVKAIGDLKQGGYRLKVSRAGVPMPQWDTLEIPPMSELLKLAFGDRIIHSTSHPLLQDV